MCSYLGCYPPVVPRGVINAYLGKRDTILDPFCGTGTTIVEAKRCGFAAEGIEANPIAWFACKTKTDWAAPAGQIASVAALASKDLCGR